MRPFSGRSLTHPRRRRSFAGKRLERLALGLVTKSEANAERAEEAAAAARAPAAEAAAADAAGPSSDAAGPSSASAGAPPRARKPWVLARLGQGNHSTASLPAPGLLRAQQYCAGARVCSSVHVSPAQLFRTAHAKSKKARLAAKVNGEPVAEVPVKKRAAFWKDAITPGVMSAALLFGGMGAEQHAALDAVFDFLRRVSAPVLVKAEVEAMVDEGWARLAELERLMPRSQFVWTVHSIGHLAQQALDLGPAREWWAFSSESFMGSVKRAGACSVPAGRRRAAAAAPRRAAGRPRAAGCPGPRFDLFAVPPGSEH